MRIAICEDLQNDARLLGENLTRYLAAYGLCAEVDQFSNGEAFLQNFEVDKYQIIFMDIYMAKNGLTGLDVAQKVRNVDKNAALVFTTTSDEYILAGYSFAVYYIIKPVTYENLVLAMEKCRVQIERFAKTMEIIVDRQPIKVRIRDIYCIEIIQRNCVFTFAARKVTAVGISMEELIAKLDGLSFVQCHRSYIINILHVRKITETEFILKSGERVPIGRKFKAAAGKAYRDCFAKLIQGEIV